MKNDSKKGFTIVELIIAIAVVALIASVLIPTFSNLINKANLSNDRVLVSELNKLVQMYQVEEDIDVARAMQIAKENGYDITKLTSKSKGNALLWDEENDSFHLVATDKNTGIITEWLVGSQKHTSNGAFIFLFSNRQNTSFNQEYNYLYPVKEDNIQSTLDYLVDSHNASVTLVEDAICNLAVNEGADICLNLNGNVIANDGQNATLTVKSGAKLTIVGEGILQNCEGNLPIIYVESGGELVIEEGSFICENNGYLLQNEGNVVINGGNFISKGDFCLQDGNLQINGGVFQSNGGIFASNSQGLSVVTTGDFAFSAQQGMGEYLCDATCTICVWPSQDATKRLICQQYPSDFDCELVVQDANGKFFYYQDIDSCDKFFDGDIIYLYASSTLCYQLSVDCTITVYYMKRSVEELDIVASNSNGNVTKQPIDVANIGADKGYIITVELLQQTGVNIGNQNYQNLDEALGVVQEGQTILLLGNHSHDYTLSQTPAINFTIDLNGKQLLLQRTTYIADGCSLTILDSAGGGVVSNSYSSMFIVGNGNLDIQCGEWRCFVNSNDQGLVKADLSQTTIVGRVIHGGRYNFDATNYVVRGYTCQSNGDGTWRCVLAEGYNSTTTMQLGYVEVFDGKYYAVKIDSDQQLTEQLKGKIVNGYLQNVDPTNYVADGYVVQIESGDYYKVVEGTSVTSGKSYTTPVSQYLEIEYLSYQSGNGYKVVKVRSSILKGNDANTMGKIVAGWITASQFAQIKTNILADGYQWTKQPDGSYKVTPIS